MPRTKKAVNNAAEHAASVMNDTSVSAVEEREQSEAKDASVIVSGRLKNPSQIPPRTKRTLQRCLKLRHHEEELGATTFRI
jgi:hypothetical protein